MLAVLFGAPDRSFYANELIALAGSDTGAAQRKLAGLRPKRDAATLSNPVRKETR